MLYYVLALTPFAVWLAVAIVRSSRRPFADFLVLGVLYGLSLVVVHQLLWDIGPSLGHNPPESAVDFANQFSPAWRELATRAYSRWDRHGDRRRHRPHRGSARRRGTRVAQAPCPSSRTAGAHAVVTPTGSLRTSSG